MLAAAEPRELAFTWGEETLRFELSPREGGTRLVLVDELPAGAAARNAAGWETCLDRLAGLEPAADAWKAHFERCAAAFAPELGPQEGPPAGYKGDEAEG
ncbi:MAG TPA: SRPBCC domain-containing protein [Solirubrobacterales bacterium]